MHVLARVAEQRGDAAAAALWWERARHVEGHEGAPPHAAGNGHGAPHHVRRISGALRAIPRRPTPAGPLRAVSFRGDSPTPTFVASFSGTRAELVRSLVADADGLLLASPTASDDLQVLESMAAAVAGVGDIAQRAARHLGLGPWRSIVLETTGDALAIAPASDGALTVLSVARHVPPGRTRALLRLAAARAAADGF